MGEARGRQHLFSTKLQDSTVVSVDVGVFKNVHDEFHHIVQVLGHVGYSKFDGKIEVCGEERCCRHRQTDLSKCRSYFLSQLCFWMHGWIVHPCTAIRQHAETGTRLCQRLAFNADVNSSPGGIRYRNSHSLNAMVGNRVSIVGSWHAWFVDFEWNAQQVRIYETGE